MKTRLFKYIETFTAKNGKFADKKSDIFLISAQNIDCGYSLELPQQGSSNEYPQSMFLSRNKKNNVYPCKPQFCYIKVGFKGVKIIYIVCFRDDGVFGVLSNVCKHTFESTPNTPSFVQVLCPCAGTLSWMFLLDFFGIYIYFWFLLINWAKLSVTASFICTEMHDCCVVLICHLFF